MPDHLVAELKATLQSLGSAVHMLKQADTDPHAVAFVCGGAEQRLRDILAALESPPAQEQAPARGPRRKRVLIADPERNWAGALAQALSENGNEVRAFAGADDARVASDDGFAPEVVLMELGMANMAAFDLVRTLSGDAERRPVMIAVTSWSRKSDRRLAWHAGIDLYLNKPVPPQAVVNLVATLR